MFDICACGILMYVRLCVSSVHFGVFLRLCVCVCVPVPEPVALRSLVVHIFCLFANVQEY